MIFSNRSSSKILSGAEASVSSGVQLGSRMGQLSSKPSHRLLARLPPKSMMTRRWLSTSG